MKNQTNSKRTFTTFYYVILAAILQLALIPLNAQCTADAGTLSADVNPVQLAGSFIPISASELTAPVIPSNYERLYVLTTSSSLIIQQTGPSPSFDVSDTGDYTIHTLIAETSDNTDPNFLDLSAIVPGTTTGADVLTIISNNNLCADLDVAGAPIEVQTCNASAGTLSSDVTPVQLAGTSVTISATQVNSPVIPANYEIAYLLTSGAGLVIEATSLTPSFTVSAAGNYRIHTAIGEVTDNNDPNFLDISVIIPGVTTAGDVLTIIANNNLCADIDVNGAPITVEACSADAGTLTADVTPVQIVDSVVISATQGTAPTVPTNYETVFVLTSGASLVIEQIGASPSFTVTAAGNYTIHTLVAELSDNTDPNFLDASVIVPGTTTGGDVLGIVTNNNLCASLDVTGAPVVVEACSADAGTLTADVTPVQIVDSVVISATQGTAPTVPTNYETVFVLTSGASLVIEQIGASPSFTVTAAGNYTIHTLVAELSDNTDPNFLDASIIVPGTTTGGDVLGIVTNNNLCASLDVTGAPVVVEACSADAGTLTADVTPVQIVDSVVISATQGTAPTVPTNYETVFVLTSGASLVIEQIGASPSFTVTAAGNYTIHTLVAELSDNTDPNFLDASVIVPGTTTGGDVLGIVTNNNLCASLDVTGAPVVVEACSADAGTLTADVTPVQIVDSVVISATQGTAPTVPTNYETVFVLTSGASLVIEQIGASPSFTVTAAGNYTIHTLVAELSDNTDPNFLDASIIVPGTTTGGDVLGIVTNNNLCASLDVTGAPIVVEACSADAGTLTADVTPVQIVDSVVISATQGTAPTVPTNYETVFVLTSGASLVIEQIGASPSFTVTAAGNYTIHTLVAELSDNTDPNFLDASVIVPGTTTGGDVLGIVTNNNLCASLDVTGAPVVVEACSADAGTLTADVTPVQIVDSVVISATQGTAPTVPTNYETVFVLTSGASLVIEQIGASPSFTVTAAGNYTIHTLVAELSDNTDPNFLDASVIVPGTTTGGDVLGIVTNNNLCASLDVAGAPITVEACSADAGTLTADVTPVQIVDSVVISATQGTAPTVPTNYETVYVLTSGAGLVIEQIGATPNFTVTTPGLYRIHTLVAELSDNTDPNFLDASVINFGVTTGVDVLGIVTNNNLCADLDVLGAQINVEACSADAGTITADFTPVQIVDSVEISATQGTAPTVPANYEVVYILTSGPTLIIEQIGATPNFTVTAPGNYTIHTGVAELSDSNDPNFLDVNLIVPGTTTGGDVLNLVTTNGLCAALDVAGAPIVVEACSADAGSLTADFTPVQIVDSVSISATQGTAPTVPANYETVYVLTSGAGLVIEQIGATPNFTVTSPGLYTIHTLVAELSDATDPNFLDASIIVPGTTTGVDVLGIVTNNNLCAALDVAGAPISVEACSADAGSLTADVTPIQIVDSVEISATQGIAPTAPTNYETVYVLTSGAGLVIEQIGATPNFTVTSPGLYTIHTLVAELSDATDPNFLDASVIVPGTTTGGDVLGIVTNNNLCASLDVAGAPIVVESCSADAGTLTADISTVQLAGGSVEISATEATAPVIPTNYEVVYVLTSGAGLVIEQTSATPNFTVTVAGSYTIHTLVAELSDNTDPNFLDVSVIVPGTTTGVDVLGIVTNNGLCAALDVTGAPIVVEACTADAGTLTADSTPVQLTSGSVLISATEAAAPVVPANYEVVYVLTSGASLVIEQTGATPSFTVTAAGDYTIHTLVAELSDNTDPNFLDVSIIVPGTTTGVDVLDIVSNNGLCAALDATGAPISVVIPTSIRNNKVDLGVSLVTNPVSNVLQLSNGDNKLITSLAVVDLTGRIIEQANRNSTDAVISMDVSSISNGTYILLVKSGSDMATFKWLKK